MKKNLILLLILPLILFGFGLFAYAQEEAIPRHYKIQLIQKEDGSIALYGHNIVVSRGSVSPNIEKQNFLSKLYSFEGEELTKSYFSMPKQATEPEALTRILTLPYYSNGKTVKIFASNDESRELLSISVEVFAQVCGDGECQDHESYENCPDDCFSGSADDYCDHIEDGICDPDCGNIKDADPDCAGENPATIYAEVKKQMEDQKLAKEKSTTKQPATQKPYLKTFIFLMILVIVVASVIVFFLLRRKS